MARMAGVNFRDFAVQRFHRSLRTQKQSCRAFKGPSNCINQINLINLICPLFGFLCSCEFHFLNEFNWNFGNKLNRKGNVTETRPYWMIRSIWLWNVSWMTDFIKKLAVKFWRCQQQKCKSIAFRRLVDPSGGLDVDLIDNLIYL